jgi:transcriptional regulator with XRE-family HTH domain
MATTKKEIEPIYRQFGSKIESLRTALGLSQAELAKRVGLTRTSIVNIEAGRQRVLLDDVEKFSGAFATSPKFLMRGIWL